MTQWQYTCNIKPALHMADDLEHTYENFIKCRDAVIAVLKTAKHYKTPSNCTDFAEMDFWDLVEDLSSTKGQNEFNEVLNAVYDWADDNRVWLGI